MEPINISVIIPSYNPDPAKLIECLKAVSSSSIPPLEVILVDDGSTSGFPEEAKGLCRIIRNEKNLGPAGARNRGAKAAKGEILCFIDSDVKIGNDTLEMISGKFSKEDIAAVQTIYSTFTPVTNFTSQYQNLYLHYNFIIVKERFLSSFASHCIAVKRNIFFEAGGFDEEVKSASIEDEHLGISLYSMGHRILLAKDITVQHLDRVSYAKLIKRMFNMGKEKMAHLIKNPETRKMDVSKTHHPASLIISILMSPAIAALLILSYYSWARIPAAAAFIVFILVNSRFFLFLNSSKGPMFTLRGVFAYLTTCLSITAGFIRGGMEALL